MRWIAIAAAIFLYIETTTRRGYQLKREITGRDIVFMIYISIISAEYVPVDTYL